MNSSSSSTKKSSITRDILGVYRERPLPSSSNKNSNHPPSSAWLCSAASYYFFLLTVLAHFFASPMPVCRYFFRFSIKIIAPRAQIGFMIIPGKQTAHRTCAIAPIVAQLKYSQSQYRRRQLLRVWAARAKVCLGIFHHPPVRDVSTTKLQQNCKIYSYTGWTTHVLAAQCTPLPGNLLLFKCAQEAFLRPVSGR